MIELMISAEAKQNEPDTVDDVNGNDGNRIENGEENKATAEHMNEQAHAEKPNDEQNHVQDANDHGLVQNAGNSNDDGPPENSDQVSFDQQTEWSPNSLII